MKDGKFKGCDNMNTAIIKLRAAEEIERRKTLSNYSVFSAKYLKIVNKEKKQCTLKLNSVQQEINDIIEDKNSRGEPVRLIILKARQEGVSTFFQGRIMHAAATRENVNGLVVAHRDDSTTAIFEKAKYMYDNLPEDIKPIKKASNAKELIFDTPSNYTGQKKGLNSKIRIQTAGSAGIGRSDTFNYAHLSEFGLWEGKDDKSPANQLSGIMDAIPDVAGTEVIIESTAFGYNDFKTIWDDAVAGKNNWTPLFYPWHKHDEYVKEFESEEEREAFIKTMSDYEKYLHNGLSLPLERVNWWRNKLKSKNNDMNTMKQENPSTPEEAFIFSGSPIFNTEKIIAQKNKLVEKYKSNPPKRGYFYFEWNNPDIMDMPKPETIVWQEDKNGHIRLYEDVKSGYPYAIGGDTKGTGDDFFSLTCKNNHTGKRCATLHGQMKSKEYTAQAYCMGYYFNEAVIAIERNFNTYPIELLSDWHYPRQYVLQKLDTFSEEMEKRYGWKTDGNTRPLIIEREKTLIDENIEQFTDIGFLDECLTFVDCNGRPDSMSGHHDDILFSDMIAEAAGEQQTRIVNISVQPDYDEDEDDKPKGSNFFD
jgi:hypothetical protein